MAHNRSSRSRPPPARLNRPGEVKSPECTVAPQAMQDHSDLARQSALRLLGLAADTSSKGMRRLM